MRILVIGSGGREHALVWKLRQSPTVTEVLVAPGNGGMEADGFTTLPAAVDDIPALVQLARDQKVDLVVPGPELPLTLGIVDAMQEANIPCFGPDKYCAQLEGSKFFAKAAMARGHVPTAHSAYFTDYDDACAYVRTQTAQNMSLVVKADGLAAGKGVVVAHTEAEALDALKSIMLDKIHGAAGDIVVIEEFLQGEEASFLCFCDGERAVALPSAQDHKAVFDGDTGPNTGGMGAYSPAPIVPDADIAKLVAKVIQPILRVLAQDKHPFKGILYAGLMMTKDGPKVLEYNTRFGDPECQPLLMRLQSPLDQILLACVEGRLNTVPFAYTEQAALGIVLAAEGYPASYAKGMEIQGIEKADALQGVKVFHSGTVLREGKICSNGGRVLCVTALGDGLQDAQKKAYAALEHIHMDKSQYRTDIGQKGITRLQNM